MKTTLLITGLLLAGAAQASVLGILVSSRMVTTVSYQQAWECTYRLTTGQMVSVVENSYCQSSMEFN